MKALQSWVCIDTRPGALRIVAVVTAECGLCRLAHSLLPLRAHVWSPLLVCLKSLLCSAMPLCSAARGWAPRSELVGSAHACLGAPSFINSRYGQATHVYNDPYLSKPLCAFGDTRTNSFGRLHVQSAFDSLDA